MRKDVTEIQLRKGCVDLKYVKQFQSDGIINRREGEVQKARAKKRNETEVNKPRSKEGVMRRPGCIYLRRRRPKKRLYAKRLFGRDCGAVCHVFNVRLHWRPARCSGNRHYAGAEWTTGAEWTWRP